MKLYKTVYSGEWVKAGPFINRKFAGDNTCQRCKKKNRAIGWYSLKSHKFRCCQCYDAEMTHWMTKTKRRLDPRAYL